MPRRSPKALLPILALIVGTFLLFWPARTLRSDNFVFYFPKERHIVRLEVIDGANYLPVLDVLNAVGKLSGFEEKRNSAVVWFGGSGLQLKKGDKKVKVDKRTWNLLHPVRVSNGQWMVPTDFLSSVLPEVIHQRVAYELGEKRAFIGDVKPVTFTADLEPVPNGVRLTLQFTSPVTVRTASQNGKWVVFLGDEPFEAPAHALRLQNPYLSALQFDDQDGVPKLLLTPGADGLNFYPTQSGRSKFIVEVAKPAPKLAQLPATGAAPSAAQLPAPPVPPVPPSLPAVVLDPGHGGGDPGARSRDGLVEKDVVAAWGERVRAALVATNKYRIIVTRSGDTDPGFDERAGIANDARPVAFLSLHAGNLGSKLPQLAVYTYLPSSLTEGSQETGAAMTHSGVADGRFVLLPWNELQMAHVDRSRRFAQALERQFANISGLTTSGGSVEAPVRALRNIDAPAAAVEIGSFASDVDARPLTNGTLQDQIAGAIVRALDAFLGGQG
ncbi:MAG TPA: N-acetylmuramoyl-L-alanine amidase [Terriglobia bacterium]|nr:N-acetylmuramoyl-L-alanine amidase [Terriglobia bacterium]